MMEFQEIMITLIKAQTAEDQWELKVTAKIENQRHVWSLLTKLPEDKFTEKFGFWVGFGLEQIRHNAKKYGGM